MYNGCLVVESLWLQGFAKYMLDTTPTVRQHGVAIGHDARHNSLR